MIGPGSDKTESGWWCGLVVANISHVLTPRNIVIPQLLTSTGKSEICLFTMKKKSKRESFLTKNYSWQLSGAFLRNFFLVQFFSLGQLSVPCLLIIFFSGNFFSRLIFLLGQLSGACLFIKKNSQKVFYAEAIHFSGAVIWCLSLHKWPKGQETPFLSYYSVLS